MDDPNEQYPGLPRWVKVLGITVLVLILIGLAAALLLGGDHGPGRHAAP